MTVVYDKTNDKVSINFEDTEEEYSLTGTLIRVVA